VLLEHPAVAESAIVGKPDAVLTERVHAFVCLKPSVDAGTEALQHALQGELQRELQHFCAARLADYKVPETWTLTTTPLPRNANGKLLKREMRRQIIEQEVKPS
jgi:long-chain acyl-CoA synthetase